MSKPSIRILLQLLAVVVANVDAQSNARDTTVATYNAALIEVYPEVETRASILIDQVRALKSVCSYQSEGKICEIKAGYLLRDFYPVFVIESDMLFITDYKE